MDRKKSGDFRLLGGEGNGGRAVAMRSAWRAWAHAIYLEHMTLPLSLRRKPGNPRSSRRFPSSSRSLPLSPSSCSKVMATTGSLSSECVWKHSNYVEAQQL